jgi:hypothetical protein
MAVEWIYLGLFRNRPGEYQQLCLLLALYLSGYTISTGCKRFRRKAMYPLKGHSISSRALQTSACRAFPFKQTNVMNEKSHTLW